MDVRCYINSKQLIMVKTELFIWYKSRILIVKIVNTKINYQQITDVNYIINRIRWTESGLLIKSTLRLSSSEFNFGGKSPTGVISSEFRASSSIKCQNHFFTLRR